MRYAFEAEDGTKKRRNREPDLMVILNDNFDNLTPTYIGPKTAQLFAAEIGKARLVLWNGPVGLFEVPPYDQGSRVLAQTLADNHPAVVGIIAGGDTVAAVSAAGVSSRIAHLSTGGGATLEFLEGKVLPGIEALDDQP
jgi:phosphoglycerate kinase